jgi:hypothetical protein
LGRIWVLEKEGDNDFGELANDSNPVKSLSCEQWSADDYKAFLCVNRDASERVSDNNKRFFHACRLLSLLFGVGLTEHDKEWTVVDDPLKAAKDAIQDSEIAEMTKALRWVPTAVCVRAAMYRKTKHATGGSIAQGFAQKIINQMGWPYGDDAQKRISTSDFYSSTHAASPVALLAMISPKDMGHFGIINPLCGIRGTLKSLSSVSLRVVAPDQISGAAMISDSFVVLKMLRSEGLLPLLKNLDQLRSFSTDYFNLKSSGFRAHNSYGYYIRYHPDSAHASLADFNQRNPAHWPLVCELAIIAKRFYKYRTISKSPSLQTAANSSEDSGIDNTWKSLSSMRATAPSGLIASYYYSMKGSNVASSLQKLVESDITDEEFDEVKKDIEGTINRGLAPLGDPNLLFNLGLLKRNALASAYEKYKDGVPDSMLEKV